MIGKPWIALGVGAILLATLYAARVSYVREFHAYDNPVHAAPVEPTEKLTSFQHLVLADLKRQCASKIVYKDGYFSGGEPPSKIGVCTDVVIRSYRAAGVYLQSQVAADIRSNPKIYHIDKPDPNIDHRRCRNLTIFFKRHALTLPASGPKADWEPGDIVFWDTAGDGHVDHVGVIANHLDANGDPTVTHHWPGQLVSEMDWLYRLPTLSHYRWNANDAVKARNPV